MKDLRLRVLDHLKHGEDSVNNTCSALGGNRNKLIDVLKELKEYIVVRNEKNNRHMHKLNPDKLEFLNLLWSGSDFDKIINELKLFLENPQEKITHKDLDVIDIFISCLQARQEQCSHVLSSPISDKVVKEFAQDEYEKCSKISGLIISLLQKIDSGLAHRYSLALLSRSVILQGSIDEKWKNFKKIFSNQSSY